MTATSDINILTIKSIDNVETIKNNPNKKIEIVGNN